MRVLILGGLGFIGSNLALRCLANGDRVIILDNLEPSHGGNLFNIKGFESDLEIIKEDICTHPNLLEVLGSCDVIFSLAGQTSHIDSMGDPFKDLYANTKTQVTLLECLRKNGLSPRIIYASTRQLYGKPEYLPVDEEHKISPVDVNGINKHAAEQYYQLYSDIYGIRSVCLRLTNIFGPRMRIRDARQTFVGSWIRSAIEERSVTIFGDGTQMRDYVYIDDAVTAFLSAAKVDFTGIVNIGNDVRLSHNAMASIFADCMGDGFAIHHVDFPSERKVIDIGDYYSGTGKARDVLGWEATTTIHKAIDKSINFYKLNFKYYV
jgi:UDP-glucose 4-epimerase